MEQSSYGAHTFQFPCAKQAKAARLSGNGKTISGLVLLPPVHPHSVQPDWTAYKNHIELMTNIRYTVKSAQC